MTKLDKVLIACWLFFLLLGLLHLSTTIRPRPVISESQQFVNDLFYAQYQEVNKQSQETALTYRPQMQTADCIDWAFGAENGHRGMDEADELWNERHSDIFVVEGTDYAGEVWLKIEDECKKRGY